VQVPVQQELQRPLEDPVEGSEGEGEVEGEVVEVAAAEVPVLLEAPQGVQQATPVSLVVATDPLEQTDYLPSPMVPVRVPVLASWGDSALVESLDPPLVDIAGGAVATMGQPPVETALSTRWSLPW
jgi:hypothetical protein